MTPRLLEEAGLSGAAATRLARALDRKDAAAVAALASKRAGLNGRGPSMSDVNFVFALAGVRDGHGTVDSQFADKIRGVGHSYFMLRAFVDGVAVDDLRGTTDAATR